MSTISLLRMWNDPGFTDGCVEVPAFGNLAVLPQPDVTIGTVGADPVSAEINPSKGRLFSELKLKRAYSDCQNLSYLEMTVDYNTGNDRVYFGFIDSVEIVSDTDEYPAVLIKWHVDLWRTYLGQAVFGYGLVTRRIRAESDPIQNVPSRFKRVSDTVYNLVSDNLVGGGCFWAIINYTHEGEGNVTETRVIVCPVAKTPNTIYYMRLSAGSTVYRVPTLNQWILGDFDEILGLAPSSISSVFLSPIPPLLIDSGTGTLNDPFTVIGSTPSPEPQTESYDGPVIVYPTGVSTEGVWVTMSDGSRILTNAWSNTPIRSCRYAYYRYSHGQNYYTHTTLSGRIRDANDTTILETAVGSSNQICAMSVDDYVRAVIGDVVFDNLANGDKVSFSNIHGLYTSGSLSQIYRQDTSDIRNSRYYFDWLVTVGSSIAIDTELTFNNGTFGGYWVVVNGLPVTSRMTLTTYTSATSTADYGFEHKTYDQTEYAYLYTKTNKFAEYDGSLSSPVTTTDAEQFVVTDLDGSVIGSVPWGLTVQTYTYRCVISASAGFVQFRFDGLNSSAEGLQFTIPLPTLDITSNSWSDYVYSGQRDYDIEQRRIARERALVEGLGGALSGGAQGAMLGGLKESQSFLPSDRTIANASMFGFLGAGASIAGSLINYASAGYYNEKLQSASDMLQARQLDSITTPGNGCDWLYYGRPYQIRSIVPDDYSLGRFENDVSLNGISVSEPTADCTALIHGTGPLAIENLIVRGNIPAEAKQYIKQKINDGVRLI